MIDALLMHGITAKYWMAHNWQFGIKAKQNPSKRDSSSLKRKTTLGTATKQKLHFFGWEASRHPLYSLDSSPSDFHFFGLLNEAFGGKRFDYDAAVEAFVHQWFQEQSKKFYDDGIQKYTEN